CGSFSLSPMATLIEEQSVRWIAELVGMPAGTGGILVSGGNMANLVAYWAARAAGAGHDVRAEGVASSARLTAYCSSETHTWIQKAADLSGIGTNELRWIPVDRDRRMDIAQLKRRLATDRAAGHRPFLIVGTAGTV